ncbi:glycosyltransferase family 2 protein [Nocardioides panacisoli]|uniref:glycosyltransferase family 2 protein n=1 Tax=Nocardioides panacisoli TaxID=627624 RepID=UPI001C638662|nr:glycosyltransferase family 2 protein [Nocardioides panacisoli]QYJ02483.1 glycosyltransferase family 2 protein [Nocardioides panacisoli]
MRGVGRLRRAGKALAGRDEVAVAARRPAPPRPRGPAWDDRGRTLEEGELPRVAAITMARDEGPMIRRWVEHYGAAFGAEHVYVVDDHSSDGSTDDLPATVLRYPYLDKYGFEPSRMGIVSGLAHSLLFAYDAVLFCDADEFVVADPKRHESLRHLVAALADRPAVAVAAYNVIHDVAHEAPLDLDRPLLQQRRYAQFTPLMCKPSLKFVRADWSHASHAVGCEFSVEPDLVMFHMKFADRDQLAVQAARRQHLNVSENRAQQTSWARSGDEMVALLDEVSGLIDADDLGRFRPAPKRLEQIVRHEGEPGAPNERWRSTGDGQVIALRKGRFVAIPPRFQDLV